MFMYLLVLMLLSFFLVFMGIIIGVVHTPTPFYHFGVHEVGTAKLKHRSLELKVDAFFK